MRTTLAIVVGVSKYRATLFSSLPGAAADARAVSQSLASWGVLPQNIRVLIDEDATRSSILQALRVWPFEVTSGGDIRLIVFYAGHGARVKETGRPDSSVLLTYDTDPSDRKGTGVSLSDLMSALTRVRPVETYLFLDACSLRIDILENILPDSEVLSASGSSCLFCLVASGLSDAFEDREAKAGFFTTSILRHLATIRHSHGTCVELVRRVQTDLKAQGLPAAEFYMIGNDDCFPLPNSPQIDLHASHAEPELVPRNAPLSALRDVVVQNPGQVIWMWGESGRGKTVLLHQMRARTRDSIYCSVPRAGMRPAEIWVHLATELAEQLPVLFPSGRPLSGEPRNTLAYVSNRMPGCMVIIDHAERLHSDCLGDVISELGRSTVISIVASRQLPDPKLAVVSWECPRLERGEVEAFLQQYGRESQMPAALLEVASRRNPLELRALLAEGSGSPHDLLRSRTSPSIEKAIGAIVDTQGFVDELIFNQSFKIQRSDISRLSEMGLIIFQQGRYVPHDLLLELAADLGICGNDDATLDYLTRQVEATPRNLWACQRLAEKVVEAGYKAPLDPALVLALESLSRVRNWDSVETLGTKIADTCSAPSNAAVYAAEQLVRLARYSTVDRVIQAFGKFILPDEVRDRMQLIEAERLWWFGDFERAIELSELTLSESTDHVALLSASVNLGIAYFFRGEWKQSIETLENVVTHDQLDPRLRGWANLILGTIYGLRGVDIHGGRDLLMSSIRLLDQVGDDAGLAVAWGNLGEMTWKTGDYRASLVQLTTGFDIASAMDGPALKLEIARCLVHLRLRMDGPWSTELEEAQQLANNLYQKDMGRTVGMQLWNTFATVAAYRGDIQELEKLIQRAEIHTSGNAEYEIYTLGNKGLHAALTGDVTTGLVTLDKAVELAVRGENMLAIKQILGDVQYIHRQFSTSATASILAAAEAWRSKCDLDS